jgi:hypothetical protein
MSTAHGGPPVWVIVLTAGAGAVCVPNPDAVPGVYNPPGTPAARYASQA